MIYVTFQCSIHLIMYCLHSHQSPSVTPSAFHSRLKTHLFHKSFSP